MIYINQNNHKSYNIFKNEIICFAYDMLIKIYFINNNKYLFNFISINNV